MKRYYVTEIFYSVQGEGQRVGVPSVFIRLFGCNLQCQGFGMPPNQLSSEREHAVNIINTQDITSINQLPLVTTGCDSYVAWDKRFRHLSEHLTIDEIVERIVDVTPHKSLRCIDVVFTGGEPMLQQELINESSIAMGCAHGLRNITIETNGTKLPNYKLWQNVASYGMSVLFSVSQKLSCSGETIEKRLNMSALHCFFNELRFIENIDCVYKFVVDDESALDEIDDIVYDVHDYDTSWVIGNIPTIYLMAVGGTKDDYLSNCRAVADIALNKGYRYSPRMHIDLFGNEWST